jgi:long-chain acyl-CoA synthetase
MLAARFLKLAREAPEAPAIVEEGEVITRRALCERARERARIFGDSGKRAGDVIPLQLPNSAELVACILAASEMRLVVILIDRDAQPREVEAVTQRFGTVNVAEAFALKLTSGSSGTPKAIVCSEASLVADAMNICSSMDIRPDDVNLGAIPFSHSYGFSNLVTPLLIQGTPIVISNDYLPLQLIALANRHRCTIAPLIPMVFEHLASLPADDGRFETVRTFISAGAPLAPSTSRRFRERFGVDIHSFYGCSEVGGISYDRAGASVERGTVGAPLNGVTVTLDDARRLVVRGASVTPGYLLDAETFIPFGGRFESDDLAEIAEGGEIALRGRASELINTAGRKVNPAEVEKVIAAIDGVRQVKVYGEPAGARGDVVAAVVVAASDVTRDMIRQFCRAHLSSHKVPRIVKLVERIPVDERGKVKRSALALL